MRRPPDKDGPQVMSERDIGSSNATLALFGGARQKSWMLGPGGPVRPTPRTSISKASGSPATLAQRTSTAVLPSPAPSDESSPILSPSLISNDVLHHNQKQSINKEDQHLGVSGVSVPAVTISQSSEAMSQAQPITQQQYGIRSSIPETVRVYHPVPINTNLESSRAISFNSPLPLTSTSQSLADAQAAFRSAREIRSPSVPLLSPNQEQSRGSTERPRARNATPPTTVTPQNLSQSCHAPREQLLSPSPVLVGATPAMTIDQPPLPASVLLPTQNQPNPNSSSAPSHPHKRQRIHTSLTSLKPQVSLINAHIDSVGGVQYLNNHLERPRFQLLAEACNTEDLFYVALHQLFCVWDSPGRAIIASFAGILQGIPSTPMLADAFKVLGQLIRDNEGLAPNHLKWFVGFPSPFPDLVKTSEGYRNVLSSVGVFLSKLASEWSPLSRLCGQRGYPPLIDEMINRMGLPSAILQQIMFTATRRNLGVDDDRYGEQMEKVFSEDQRGFQQFTARINAGRPPTAKEIESRSHALKEKYLFINSQRIQARRISGPITGSLLAGSPVMPGQESVQRPAANNSTNTSLQPHRQDSNPALNQSLSNPGPWHSIPQAQHGRVTSTLSHVVTGRSPSVTGHQGYPSPTFLQGLSMNSPVVQSPVQQQQGFQWSGPTPVVRSNAGQALAQNVMGYPIGNQNGHFSASQSQSVYQPQQHAVPQQQMQTVQHNHHQLSIQRHQQIAAQQQQQPAMQSQHWQNQTITQAHEQVRQARQTHHQAQQAQQPMQLQQQQQQMEQHRQQMVAQSVLAMNRAAQLRRNSEAVDGQRVNSRNNSISSAGRLANIGNSPNGQLSRPSSSSNNLGLAAQSQAVQMYNSTQSLQRSLVPPLGFVQPSQPINPDMTALHQAHVRSPRLVLDGSVSELPEDDPSRRFYQAVKYFALGPTKIPVVSALSIFEFSISEASYDLIAKYKITSDGCPPIRTVKRGSLQYRLRCITSKSDTTKCSVSDWVITDTVWPDTVFLEINSHQLELRRKTHHGKDLPIDITSFVVPKSSPGNVNRIKVSIPRLRKAIQDVCYFIAVEVVEVLQHAQIMEMCTQNQRIPHSKTFDAIKKSLAPPPSDDDDDFAMVVSDLSIDLADPFSARIFEVPVRGSSCLHRECFDLETFLMTRNSKSKRPGQPSMIDVWKCPLCGNDARPYSLQVDDFLASVRAELARQDNLDAKAILISMDGSWRAKPEPRAMKRKATGDLDGNSDDDDDDSSDGEGTARRQQAIARTKNPYLNGGIGTGSKEVEVIELDDD